MHGLLTGGVVGSECLWPVNVQSHTCGVLAATSEVKCWGSNSYGQSSPPAGESRALVPACMPASSLSARVHFRKGFSVLGHKHGRAEADVLGCGLRACCTMVDSV